MSFLRSLGTVHISHFKCQILSMQNGRFHEENRSVRRQHRAWYDDDGHKSFEIGLGETCRESERAQLDSKTSEDGDGERRREGGREEGNIPVLFLDVRPSVRPSICRGWDLEVGIAMTTACFNVFLSHSHFHSRSHRSLAGLRSHLANGATYKILRVGQKRTEKVHNEDGGHDWYPCFRLCEKKINT